MRAESTSSFQKTNDEGECFFSMIKSVFFHKTITISSGPFFCEHWLIISWRQSGVNLHNYSLCAARSAWNSITKLGDSIPNFSIATTSLELTTFKIPRNGLTFHANWITTETYMQTHLQISTGVHVCVCDYDIMCICACVCVCVCALVWSLGVSMCV